MMDRDRLVGANPWSWPDHVQDNPTRIGPASTPFFLRLRTNLAATCARRNRSETRPRMNAASTAHPFHFIPLKIFENTIQKGVR